MGGAEGGGGGGGGGGGQERRRKEAHKKGISGARLEEEVNKKKAKATHKNVKKK